MDIDVALSLSTLSTPLHTNYLTTMPLSRPTIARSLVRSPHKSIKGKK
jgi:hypothetical protein